MSPSRLRRIVGTASLGLFFILFFLTYLAVNSGATSVRHPEIVMLATTALNFMVIVVTMSLSPWVGIVGTLGALWIVYPWFVNYDVHVVFAFAASSLVSWSVGTMFCRNFFYLEQYHKLAMDRAEENANILRDEVNQNNADILHLERRLKRYTQLNEITEQFSSTLKEDEIAKVIVDNIYGLFGKSDRVLLYRVNQADQELNLIHSKRIGDVPYVRLKKGDIFDRWVVWKKQPLLVDNTRKDFRFSIENEKLDQSFTSLIAAPLVSGERILGLIRTDSKTPSFYTQEDLRLLDIVADLASVAIENSFLYQRLTDMAVRDSLTALYVQKYFKDALAQEVRRFLESNIGFSLVLFDIDNFKDYNDKYGHMVGDLVLKHLAAVLTKEIKPGDIAARYGGEEFAVLLVGKDKKEAEVFALRLQDMLREAPVVLRREKTPITISIGIAACPEDSKMADDIFRFADRRLYKAKKKGKNRICGF